MNYKCFYKKWIAGLFAACFCALPLASHACPEVIPTGSYRIGYDVQWPTADFNGLESTVTAFSLDLMNEIAQLEKRSFLMRKWNGDELLMVQSQHRIEGHLSPLSHTRSLESFFLISDPYLFFGPDLHLHLVACLDEGHDLVSVFNHGLRALKKTGRYAALLERWGLQDFAQ